jgi:uncharacterized protein
MNQRLSLITPGVRDVSRAQAFYQALGWHLDGGVDDETDHVAFFQAGGLIVALWDRGKLARDSGVADAGGWGGVTLAYNVRSPEQVDAVLAEARDAGATIAPRAPPRSGAATRASSSTRRPPLGGGAQPRLDRARGRPNHAQLTNQPLNPTVAGSVDNLGHTAIVSCGKSRLMSACLASSPGCTAWRGLHWS